MTRPLKGVVFDLDGTLVNSVAVIRDSLNRLLAKHGRRSVSLDEVAVTLGDGAYDTIRRLFIKTGDPIDDQQISACFEDYLAYQMQFQFTREHLYPGLLECLDALSRHGIALGICTNKFEVATRKLLTDVAIIDYFTAIAGCDTFPVRKPHAGHVLGVLKQMDVPTDSSVMVGDSINDVLAAHAAGIPCIVVTHGYGQDVESQGADAIIDGFIDLPRAIASLGLQIN